MYCSESNNSSSRLPYTNKWYRLDTQQQQQLIFCTASAGTRKNTVVMTGAALQKQAAASSLQYNGSHKLLVLHMTTRLL